jgi:hypothetical protein
MRDVIEGNRDGAGQSWVTALRRIGKQQIPLPSGIGMTALGVMGVLGLRYRTRFGQTSERVS